MSKSFSLKQAIAATAIQKRDAAKARFLSVDAEKPRDVILRVCQTIADRLASDGFSFVKSGMQLKRVQNGRVHIILFQSDMNNIPGQRAAVWMYAGVKNAGSPDFLRVEQIGNLLAEPTWMEWNFADAAVREAEIDDAVAAIRQIILPFFAEFNSGA